MFVPDTFASEDDPEVKTPVEDEYVIVNDDVAVPASWPKRSWESTHEVELGNA